MNEHRHPSSFICSIATPFSIAQLGVVIVSTSLWCYNTVQQCLSLQAGHVDSCGALSASSFSYRLSFFTCILCNVARRSLPCSWTDQAWTIRAALGVRMARSTSANASSTLVRQNSSRHRRTISYELSSATPRVTQVSPGPALIQFLFPTKTVLLHRIMGSVSIYSQSCDISGGSVRWQILFT